MFFSDIASGIASIHTIAFLEFARNYDHFQAGMVCVALEFPAASADDHWGNKVQLCSILPVVGCAIVSAFMFCA